MDIHFCSSVEELITERAYSVYAPCMYEPTFEKYKKAVEGFDADKAVMIVLCSAEGETAGMLAFRNNGGDISILGIAVDIRNRGKGIGRAMIGFAAEKMNARRVCAETDGEAVGFYERCGFSAEKRTVVYPDGETVRYICVLER